MKKIAYIYYITFLVLGTSCKSIKNLAARDDSRREKKQPANQSGELVFLDNVSVTPGSAKTATAESGKTSKKYQPYSKSGYFNI